MDPQLDPINTNAESEEEETPTAFDPLQMRATSKPRPFLCPQCPKTYILRKYLNVHMKVHSADNPHVCPLCDKAWANDSHLTAHLRSHTGEKLFKCSASGCGKEFALRHTLDSHIRNHHGEKIGPKPTCAICGTSFAHTDGLKLHNQRYHNPQSKQYPCDTCGKVFPVSTKLKRHLESHLPDDPQDCPTCGKSCRTGLALKEHMQRHSRPGNNNCDRCDKNFTTKILLRAHIRTVHSGRKYNRKRNHVCSFCGFKLRSPGDLTVHLRTHTGERPFKCPSCSKAFATMKTLQNHEKQHTGKNLEECQFCGRKFALSSNLSQHLRTHTGETPYKCGKCGKAFRWATSLESHTRAAHSGQQKNNIQVSSTQAHIDSIVPIDPMADTSSKNSKGCGPLTEAVESNSQLYLDKGFQLRQLTIPIPRMSLEEAGGGVLELRSGGECWYVCRKCGRGSNRILIRSHALWCEFYQCIKPVNETGQPIL